MKVLFIDTVHPILMERLSAAGMDCREAYTWSREEVESVIHQYDGLVIRSRFKVDKALLALAKRLKFVARSGSGLENIHPEAAQRQGVLVINSPEGNAPAVGEHCLAMLLALSNKLLKGHTEITQNIWDREGNRGWEVSGKTIGIIGLGHTGSAFAKLLSAFGCRVVAYDKYKPESYAPFAKRVGMQSIFDEADVVSLHLPLTNETKYLVNQEWISRFKKNFILLNTCRGPVVDTHALVDALKSRKISGAGLDVLEYEKTSFDLDAERLPKDFHYLVKATNVVLSPHVAGWSVESYFRLSDTLATKILKHFA